MKTLVIHPQDSSTDFLIPIYMNLKSFPDFNDVTIIRGGMTKAEVNQLITEHDRIMMMGHGSPSGLFAVGQFGIQGMIIGHIIDRETVPLLQNKECIFIWCNADKFVETYNLKGLYSGMFISEVGEANYCGLPGTPQDTVTESNDFFAKELGSVSEKSLDEMYQHIRYSYGMLAEGNAVAEYNHNRLYLNS
jgi:hypothetical protein